MKDQTFWNTYLQIPRIKQARRLVEVTRLVHLLEVVGLRPVGPEHLHEKGLPEVKELVLLKVC